MQVTTSLSASLSSTREPGGSSGSPQSESETKNIKEREDCIDNEKVCISSNNE